MLVFSILVVVDSWAPSELYRLPNMHCWCQIESVSLHELLREVRTGQRSSKRQIGTKWHGDISRDDKSATDRSLSAI
jgi:hypothetical protein